MLFLIYYVVTQWYNSYKEGNIDAKLLPLIYHFSRYWLPVIFWKPIGLFSLSLWTHRCVLIYWHYYLVEAQIVTSLASGTLFQLVHECFWHDLSRFWSLPFYLVWQGTSGLFYAFPVSVLGSGFLQEIKIRFTLAENWASRLKSECWNDYLFWDSHCL